MAAYPDDRENPRNDDGFDRGASAPKAKSGNGVLISMIVIGVLLVGGLTFALFYFLGGSGKIDNEMLAYLPADSTLLAGMEVEDLLKNSKIKDAINKLGNKAGTDPFKEVNEKLKPAGLTIDDFSRVLTGFTGDPDKEVPTVVMRTKKAFDKAKLAAVMEAGEEKKKGDTTYYAGKKGSVAIMSGTRCALRWPSTEFCPVPLFCSDLARNELYLSAKPEFA